MIIPALLFIVAMGVIANSQPQRPATRQVRRGF